MDKCTEGKFQGVPVALVHRFIFLGKNPEGFTLAIFQVLQRRKNHSKIRKTKRSEKMVVRNRIKMCFRKKRIEDRDFG